MQAPNHGEDSEAPWVDLGRSGVDLPHRVLGDALRGEPHLFNFSGASAERYAIDNHELFARQIEEELRTAECTWGIGRYLENRSVLLRAYPQMISESRVFHAGVDLMAPFGTKVYAPLGGVVEERGFDSGLGNYGAYLRLRHDVEGQIFFSFYGHLDRDSRRAVGDRIEAGEQIASLGQGEDAGGWFPHLHLQVLTPRAVEEGMTLVGYITEEMLAEVELFFPSPWPLIRA